MMDGPATLQAVRSVSRETLDRLQIYADLLRRWNRTMNLVSPASLDHLWSRHILDSAQVFDLAPDAATWVDLGSGGGFPGLVISILAADERPGLVVTLVEADARKCAFLATVAREAGVAPGILTARAEDLPPLAADVVSARALAPLSALLGLAAPHLAPSGTTLFPKGARHQPEIEQALADWRFAYQKHPSLTDPAAVILSIKGLSRV
jgi:16S rRNA (guanine527-N7)-methyltransferase